MHPPVKLLFAGFLGALCVTVSLTDAPARTAAAAALQPVADADEGEEVLARGPVHEAYAATVEMPRAGEIAPNAPPAPIEELPPDQRPEGDNVQWIPGYWDWDDERTDFIWVSGFWRVPPPNHVWVPGSWNKVATGYQWTSGFWQVAQPNQAQPELEYLPMPPEPLELGPSVPAPDATSVYVAGSWLWRGRYVWRPGYWIAHRPGWVWVPSHYRWTPLGCVFINGYWDYPLDGRGVLFAPVYYPRRAFAPGFFFTPRYVVATPVLFGSLFVRRGFGCYFFGDYYGVNYGRRGFQPWCAPALRGAVVAVPARGWHYDPLWNYYSVHHRQNPQWATNVTNLYVGRYDGSLARPPRTLVQQNQVIQKVTNITNVNNVTNSLTVVNNNLTVNNRDVSQHVMVAPLAVTPKFQGGAKLQPISQQMRQTEANNAAEIRQLSVNRQKAEAAALKARPVSSPPPAGMAPVPQQPVKVKLDVPKSAVARAQIPDEKRQPPPAPVLPKIEPRPVPKFEVPKTDPKQKADPRPMIPPKVDPSKSPPIQPKVDPPKPPMVQPKVDPPKPPVAQPKVDPRPTIPPKIDPSKPPVVQPRVDPPKPPVVQPRVDPPKPPVVQPRVDPPKPPVVQPRVDPPKPPVVQPRVDPPKPPVVQPRVNPPKPPVVQIPKAPVVQPRMPVVQPKAVPKQPTNRNDRRKLEGMD